MLGSVNNIDISKKIQSQKQVSGNTVNVSSKSHPHFERTPEHDVYDSDGKNKKNYTGAIVGGGILSALAAFGLLLLRKGRGADGAKKKLLERLKDGWKEITSKAKKAGSEAADNSGKKWTEKVKDWFTDKGQKLKKWWETHIHKNKKVKGGEKPAEKPTESARAAETGTAKPAEKPVESARAAETEIRKPEDIKPEKITKDVRKNRANTTHTETTAEGVKKTSYDKHGIKTEVVEKDGVKTTTRYNKHDKPVESHVKTEKDGITTVRKYDGNGKLKGHTETRIHHSHKDTIVRNVYDSSGKLKERQVSVPDFNNQKWKTTVRNADKKVIRRHEYIRNGIKTTEIYDPKKSSDIPIMRILKNPDGSITEVSLSDTGKALKQVTKKNGKKVTTVFEADGKTVKKETEKLIGGEVREHEYANGRRVKSKINKGDGKPSEVKYIYGESGKLSGGIEKNKDGEFDVEFNKNLEIINRKPRNSENK